MLRLYPDSWPGRLGRFLLDLLFLAWATACAFVGWTLYHLVAALLVVSAALTGTGQTLDRWAESFRRAVPHGVPVVSDALNRAAIGFQRNAGGTLLHQGAQAEATIEHLAVALALGASVPLFLAVAVAYLPWRYRDARDRGALAAFLRRARRHGRLEQATELLAHRAVATLPLRRLMKVSDDPIGDLEAGRHDALAAALARRAGVRIPT